MQKAKELKPAKIPDLEPDAITTLLTYTWPGNVRELQNIVERALILCREGNLSFDDLIPTGGNMKNRKIGTGTGNLKLEDVTREHILYVLQKTDGKIHGAGGAAEILDVNASTLRNRMQNLGIDFSRYKKGSGTNIY